MGRQFEEFYNSRVINREQIIDYYFDEKISEQVRLACQTWSGNMNPELITCLNREYGGVYKPVNQQEMRDMSFALPIRWIN